MKKISRSALTVTLCLLVILIILTVEENRLSQTNQELQNSYDYITAIQEITGIGPFKGEHLHADLKIYINGKEFDINREEFYEKNGFTHVHEGENNKDVVHVHAEGITLGHFLTSIGMEPSLTCIAVDELEYCTVLGKRLRYVVNGASVPEGPHYIIKDLDRILVSYGADSQEELLEEIESIGDIACIQSDKC